MKVGLLVSRQGPAAIWAPSCDNGAILAAAEVNAAGGVLGRDLQLAIADAGQAPREAEAAARDLVEIEGVDAVVGMHPSNLRGAISRGLLGRAPYVYTPQYEGGEHRPHLVTTGATDDEVLVPSIAWLSENRRASRFYLVGNDYIWPYKAHQTAQQIVQSLGGIVVGRSVAPIGMRDYSHILDAIRQARPDVVVIALLGLESALFGRAFAMAGLARTMLRLGLATDESVLCAIGAENSENLYVPLNYFGHVRSSANDRFLELYHAAFGELAPPVTQFCQSCYDGIHLVANLAGSLGRSDGTALAASLRGPLARGRVRSRLQRTPMGAQLRVHLAMADGIEFRTVASC